MSDELAMEMIEKLSEELGEKELKIMALEKELEEEKKQKLQYLELCEIKEFKMVFCFDDGQWDAIFTPVDIIENYLDGDFVRNPDMDYDIMIKTILHYFGGRIMTKAEIIENLDDFGDADFEQYVNDEQGCIIDLENGKYWVCDTSSVS